VRQTIKQALALVVTNRHVFTAWAEVHAPNVIERRLGRGPIRKDSGSGNVQQFHAILFSPRRHGKDLAVVIELAVIRRCLKVHD